MQIDERYTEYVEARNFDESYILITADYELEQIQNDYCGHLIDCGMIEGNITGAFVRIGDAEYEEIWVTDSAKPYNCRTEYMRVYPEG